MISYFACEHGNYEVDAMYRYFLEDEKEGGKALTFLQAAIEYWTERKKPRGSAKKPRRKNRKKGA